MQLESETHRRSGVTLVAVRVTNDDEEARRVRVANRCDGPVWPPRERDIPVAGWDDGGWEGVLEPGETKPLGYATPATPASPAVEFAWTERAADGEPPTGSDALAQLGDPRPPHDAVTPPETGLPDRVREWLAAVSERAEADEATDADREGIGVLAARANRLREAVEK